MVFSQGNFNDMGCTLKKNHLPLNEVFSILPEIGKRSRSRKTSPKS